VFLPVVEPGEATIGHFEGVHVFTPSIDDVPKVERGQDTGQRIVTTADGMGSRSHDFASFTATE